MSELDDILHKLQEAHKAGYYTGYSDEMAKQDIKHLLLHIITDEVSNVRESKRLRQKVTNL